jgi:hypothetical protein
MRIRKYGGLGLGLVLSLILASTAVAGTIGPNYISNVGPGWNSPIWQDTTDNTTSFAIRYCRSSDSTLIFDLMHHWFASPSTGTGKKTLNCYNNSTWRYAYWYGVDPADYSVEYKAWENSASITTYYKISY